MVNKKLPTVITREEFDKIIERAKQKREKCRKKRSGLLTPRGNKLQEYIIALCFAFGGGLRISEIVGYKGISKRKNKKTGEIIIKQIVIPKLEYSQIENNMVRLLGKGQKERMTLLPAKILKQGGVTRADLKKYLPLTASRRAVQLFIEQITLEVLGKKKSFHKLRHGFGTTLAGGNRPLHEIQMMMGHSRLDTTGIYLHANPQTAIKGAEDVF